jgi:hypothetical protein
MCRGKKIPLNERYNLLKAFVVDKRTPQSVHDTNYGGDELQMSMNHLYKVRRFFLTASLKRTRRYLRGSNNLGGRPRKLQDEDDVILEALVNANRMLSDESLARKLDVCIHGPGGAPVGQETKGYDVIRSRARTKLTIKCFTPKSKHADPVAAYEHLEILAHIHEDRLIDFDETYHGKYKSASRRGKGKKGERIYYEQWAVGDRRFSIFAAYCVHGFMFYRIFERALTHLDIEHIVEHCLRPFLFDDSFVIYDNASIHMVDSTLIAINTATNMERDAAFPCLSSISNIEKAKAARLVK